MAKKITLIVSLSLIGILIIATIIMANVKTNYNVKCATPDTIYVNKKGGSTQAAEDGNQKDSIIDYINNASKEITLTALFNGNLNKKANIVQEKGTVNPSDLDFAVAYVYSQPQQMKDGNEVFYDANGRAVNYRQLLFAIDEYFKGEKEYKVYVIPDETDRYTYTYYYTVSADFSGLYGYLTNNFNK